MKKLIVCMMLILMFTGCKPVEYKDELISSKVQSKDNTHGSYFLIWASYTKDKEIIYNYYHKSTDGKIKLSYSNVYRVSIYEDVPIGEPEYVLYTGEDIFYDGEIFKPEFHVHKGSIQPVNEIDVNKVIQ